VHLVPAPLELVEHPAAPYLVGPRSRVVADAGLHEVAALVAQALSGPAAPAVEVVTRTASTDLGHAVVLELVDAVPVAAPDGPLPDPAAGLPGRLDEAYTIDVAGDGVLVRATTRLGLLRAAATVHQLVQADGAGASIPAVHVADAPRYGWRGLSLDVARHFVTTDDLERLLDLLWLYKLDVLHLHLTDDQAWRIDLPHRPELVERSSSAAVGGDPGGAYRAEDWQRILGRAAARGVLVVPEVDVPGHVNAALHADGALVPGGVPAAEYLGIEVGFSRLTAALPATGRFLGDVFADLAAMTPGEYLHIGGDEVLTMAPEEYAALVGAAAASVRAAGKRVVGWQEVATTDLAPGTVVQVWDLRQDVTPLVRAAGAGARVLLSPGNRVYLDMKYDPATPLGLDWAGHVELRDSYDWEPATLLPGVPGRAVVGVEAAIFTETLRTLDDLAVMALPRLAAVAEVAWSEPERRDWAGFATRVANHPVLWGRAGLAWHASPGVDWVG
jgi:hexosaminidase